MSEEKKYGEKIISEFNVETDLEIWENKHERDYKIKITLPEFCCLCPRSGYPDFATIYVEYIPNKFVVELKAIKLYVNSFMNRNISHEDSVNEIYSILENKLNPKWLKVVGDFNPRGNVHTVIEIDSNVLSKNIENTASKNFIAVENTLASKYDELKFEKRNSNSMSRSRGGNKNNIRSFERSEYNKDKKRDNFKNEKSRKSGSKEGFKKPEFSGEKRARIVKKS
jgi:preQ(1) synthase